MSEESSAVEKLRQGHEEKIAAAKKDQAEGFQAFKKKCQEEAEGLKGEHVKKLEQFKEGFRAKIGALEKDHSERTEEFNSKVIGALEEETKALHKEEIKKRLREQKKKDKKTFEEWVATQESVSEIDEEIFLEEQKNGRKALNKELKKEYAAKLHDLLNQKEQEFLSSLLDDEFKVKKDLMAEEEALQFSLQKELQELQRKQQAEEHSILRENLIKLQDMLEKFFLEEVEEEERLIPGVNASMTTRYAQVINEMIDDKKKEIEQDKEKCRDEFKQKVAKYEENIAKLKDPGNTASAEEKKKAFLTRKFNLEFSPPSEDLTNAQIAKLEADFQAFKTEKEQMIEAQRLKIEEKTKERMDERRAEYQPLQETHKLRLEKLTSFQKDEKERLEAKFKELNAAFEELWKKKKDEINELEKEEHKALSEKQREEKEGEEEKDDVDE